jgi:ribose-phosphate pyrophosphokinase
MTRGGAPTLESIERERDRGFDVYTGNANPELARKIARFLDTRLGKAEVFQFANENIFVRILDNARQRDVYIVQPTCRRGDGRGTVNESIMELLIMIDAFKRASAGRITAVVPYYAYGRSDKKDQPRVPITARLIADMIEVAGADRLLTMDLHQGQIQGFFSIPVDELTAVHMLSAHFRRKKLQRPVVVTDLGFAKRARAFAELLDAPLAVIEKRREGNLDRAELMNVIGEVRGRQAIIVDDEIDTAGTLQEVVTALENEGVTEMYACATHAVLSDPAVDRIREMPLAEVVVTDTIPLPAAKRLRKIKVISTAPLIGEAIRRIHQGESVGELFSSELDLVQEMSLWEERNGGGENGDGGSGPAGNEGGTRGRPERGADDAADAPRATTPPEGTGIPVGDPASRARARVAGSGPN